MKALVLRSLATALLCAGLAAPIHANAAAIGGGSSELWNGWQPPYATGATAFEVDFTGNQTATIPAQITNDPMINPFYALFLYNGSPVNPTTITYDAAANLTRVVFSGGALPNPVPAGWAGPYHEECGAPTYHFGLNGGSPGSQTPVSMHWIHSGISTPVSVLMGTWAGTFRKNDTALYAALYTETAQCSAGGWQLIPYAERDGVAVKINLTNAGPAAVTVGTTGYETGIATPADAQCLKTPACQANQIALDQLNDEHYPMPGEPGSPLTALTVDKTLQPGESVVLKLN